MHFSFFHKTFDLTAGAGSELWITQYSDPMIKRLEVKIIINLRYLN